MLNQLSKLSDSLFGSSAKIKDPHETDYQKQMRDNLTALANQSLGMYNPTALMNNSQNSYNSYNSLMANNLAGKLDTNYENQLNSIRDNNLAVAKRNIDESSGLNTGSLLNTLAKRGVLSSSVTANGVNQIAKTAANAVSDATAKENSNYSQGYANALNSQANNANQLLNNSLNFAQQQQQFALDPAKYLYSQWGTQKPIIQPGQDGFANIFGQSLADSLGKLPLAAMEATKKKGG